MKRWYMNSQRKELFLSLKKFVTNQSKVTTKNYFFRDKFFMTTNLFVTKTILFMTTRQANVLQKANMFFYFFHCLKLLSPHQFVRKSFHSPSIFFPPVFSPFWTQKNLEGNQTYDMETGKQRNTFPYLLLLEQQRQRNTFSKSVTCLHISNNNELELVFISFNKRDNTMV